MYLTMVVSESMNLVIYECACETPRMSVSLCMKARALCVYLCVNLFVLCYCICGFVAVYVCMFYESFFYTDCMGVCLFVWNSGNSLALTQTTKSWNFYSPHLLARCKLYLQLQLWMVLFHIFKIPGL